MQEESIVPSPSPKSNESIHKVRIIRGRKRRKLSVTDTDTTTTFYQHLCRDDGDDDKDSIPATSRIISYKPWKMETMLCMADRVPSANLRKPKYLPQNNHQDGFQTCHRITGERPNESDNPPPFIITDSELVNCCHEVDEMLMKTPPLSNRCIANSILEDFSLSPLSTKPEKFHSRFWEYSPQFILQSKPTKTYSRRNRSRTEVCNNRRLEFSSDDEDCMSNNSSFLSIEENTSQLEDMLNTTVVPDISEMLNENLLNLTYFYSQECLHTNRKRRRSTSVDTIPSVDENPENFLIPSNVVANLLKDICSLRENYSQKKLRSNAYSSDQEFHGFLNIPRDVEQEISLSDECCGVALLDTTLLGPQSFHIPDEDREMVLVPEVVDDYKDEWNADCPEFALIKTQEVLLKLKNASLKNPTTTSDSFKQNTTKVDLINSIKSSILNTSENSRNLPDQNYNINTEDGTYSKNATIHAEKEILNRRMDENVFLNLFESVNEHVEKQNISEMPSTSKAAMKANIERNNGREIPPANKLENETIRNLGFQTANGKIVNISKKAQKNVEKLLKEFNQECGENLEIDLEAMKSEIIQKNAVNVAARPHKSSEIRLKEYQVKLDHKFGNIPNDGSGLKRIETCNINITPQVSIGFGTAEGAQNLLREFYTEAEENNKSEINHKNSETSVAHIEQIRKDSPKEYWVEENDLANVVFSEWPLEEQLQSQSLKSNTANCKQNTSISEYNKKRLLPPLKNNMSTTKMEGFHTAGGNHVAISAKSKNIAANIMQGIQINCDIKTYEQNLIEIKNKMQSRNNEMKMMNKSCSSNLNNSIKTMTSSERNDFPGSTTTDRENTYSPLSTTKIEGFQTAGGKNVEISDKAKRVVANLLQDIGTDCEHNLVQIKNKMQSKNCELKVINKTNNTTKTMDIIQRNDSPASPLVAVRRSLDNGSTPLSPAKNNLLLDRKQSFLELSVQSPLNNSAAKSVISRKNLLSLSKKRKQRSRFSVRTVSDHSSNNNHPEDGEPNENPIPAIDGQEETPVKKKPSPAVQTPCTPTINEFFNNAQQSSTPRTDVCIKPAYQIMENDLKRISWANNSISKPVISTKHSLDTRSNITLNSSNPTTNERIGRLQMYGNAPAISPTTIDIHNNCRPSGLRRSMFRKSNN